ncbi:MAG TPA: tRNA guanosine(34) transglycosylase Tgt [Pirellulaceae bacterium]|nr:tRNA guanosine(34) transglycosylase Tgt [Pirellulaceae bacterium]HMO91690.1 tRNA guanosine(34) transglycosylase Tgt [Pirellulaceae bacterium]HMP68387.1 tRNA guanosine(34) transglycosylase Tgt [Pirellulaceae bacterium]
MIELGPAGFQFELQHVDKHSGARAGRLITPRGEILLPAFMPVGTVGSVKGVNVHQLQEIGAQIILGNTYHLALRPGDQLIAELGGLHKFIGWDRPILTDSGGFQVFSLSNLAKIDDNAVRFRSHIDGTIIELSPERSIQIQQNLGSDIAMVLDHVPALPASETELDEACRRSLLWAERCLEVPQKAGQALFGIVQGGLSIERRRKYSAALVSMGFAGYAIGGLSVGEAPPEMHNTVNATCPFLPEHRPRYLMGVGRPEDLLICVAGGVDMFDCVMPTRNGRNAMAFTDSGPLRLRNSQYRDDPRPLMENTDVPLGFHSRAYIRHLFMAGEMLGPIVLSLHNLAYYQQLMRGARAAILADEYLDFVRDKFLGWGSALPENWPIKLGKM